MTRLPTLFVSHGAPTLTLEPGPTRGFLEQLGGSIGRPDAILMVSAHWESAAPAISTAAQPETIHDFYGFPDELYRMRYAAPGAPELAARVAALLTNAGLSTAAIPDRGLDHGAWVPLMLMYPDADIPVTQFAVQTALGTAHHWRLGGALRALRDEGVLIIGSGSVTHNLRELGNYRYDSPPPDWVAAFNDWLATTVEVGDREALLDYRARAPHAVRNHPTEEHLFPLCVTAGAGNDGGRGQRLHTGYTYGLIGMDAYRFD